MRKRSVNHAIAKRMENARLMSGMPIRVSVCLLVLLLHFQVFAQDQNSTLEATIRREDSSFWDAYDHCDVEKMSQFFWPDFEFYHDKGGPTIGRDSFVAILKTGVCGNPNHRLRREAISDTVKVYPLREGDVTYGVVVSGDHYFYVSDDGKQEYRDSLAKFFHVWLLKDGLWKMTRAVSYDHRDAPYENARKEVAVQPEILDGYVGKYRAPKTGALQVSRANNVLVLAVGSSASFVLHPESSTLFFITERDLTFEFVKNEAKTSRIVVREHGEVVEEAQRE
jgi:hypothetical protein